MSTVVEGPRAARARRSSTSKRTAGSRSRPGLVGGVLWIAVFFALFAGIVALNVIVLQLTVELDGLGRERAEVKADIARLESQLSAAGSNARIERDAKEQLGLLPSDPATTTYITLDAEKK